MSDMDQLTRLLQDVKSYRCAACGVPVGEEMVCADCVDHWLEIWEHHTRKLDLLTEQWHDEELRYSEEKRAWHIMRVKTRATHGRSEVEL